MSNFIEQCLAGLALPDDIDDFVDSWHDGDSKVSLHRYLGMSKSEYSLWVADPGVLPYIINAHYFGRDVSEILGEVEALPLAARSDGPEKALKLMRWLKREGMWE
ncbi:hypothetical protein [Thiobaca trueperi]|uniref:Uncharacterized protein n=1 Tax=Thiobaca trueperi TaxID=127458 RepID=A0A4R3MY22_9GAMM|nr:hypothetical protein [Thiobaca trueperi]TCT21548.1 hypothetical protein EDC35_104408 [Thiobaca trueperi]